MNLGMSLSSQLIYLSFSFWIPTQAYTLLQMKENAEIPRHALLTRNIIPPPICESPVDSRESHHVQRGDRRARRGKPIM